MFARFLHRKRVLRRTAALLAGVALLNAFVVPEASACEERDVVSEPMPGMDHAGMSMHHARGTDVTPAAVNRTAAHRDGLPDVREAFDCHGMPCSSNCALMAGCAPHVFIAPSVTIAVTTSGAMASPPAVVSWQGRDSAPDHPPPRA